MEPLFPLEFVVEGVAASAQAGRRSRDEGKDRVREASRLAHPDGGWATEKRVAVTLYYFPESAPRGGRWGAPSARGCIWMAGKSRALSPRVSLQPADTGFRHHLLRLRLPSNSSDPLSM